MKDYFDNEFNSEDFEFNNEEWLNKINKLFNNGDLGNNLNSENSFFSELDSWDDASYIDDINNVEKMEEFKAEDLLDPDSAFSEIMRKLERIKFEKSMNDNFENIKKHGIDVIELKSKSKEDRRRVVETINIMNETYLEREEYEKCQVLKPILNKIKKEIKI